MPKDYTTKELKQALQELQKELDSIEIPEPARKQCCPFCHRQLITTREGEVLDYCHIQIKFYYIRNKATLEVIQVSTDFY